MLVTARVMKGDLPQGTKYHTYRMRNHPCSVWVRNDRQGFIYASELLRALCDEYTYRFGKVHATDTFYFNLPEPDLKKIFPHRRRTKDVPLAVGNHPLTNDPVEVYRSYYHTKSWDLKWTKRDIPFWYNKEDICPKNYAISEIQNTY